MFKSKRQPKLDQFIIYIYIISRVAEWPISDHSADDYSAKKKKKEIKKETNHLCNHAQCLRIRGGPISVLYGTNKISQK